MPDATIAALGLGGNVGQVEKTLHRAARALSKILTAARVAPLYRTTAVSPIAQPDFLNTALVGATELPPEDLLAIAKLLERLAGRRRGARHGPRPLDVDLLLYGDLVRDEPELHLPHPGMADRAFQLLPLADLAPNLGIPPSGEAVAARLARLAPLPRYERIDWSESPF